MMSHDSASNAWPCRWGCLTRGSPIRCCVQAQPRWKAASRAHIAWHTYVQSHFNAIMQQTATQQACKTQSLVLYTAHRHITYKTPLCVHIHQGLLRLLLRMCAHACLCRCVRVCALSGCRHPHGLLCAHAPLAKALEASSSCAPA